MADDTCNALAVASNETLTHSPSRSLLVHATDEFIDHVFPVAPIALADLVVSMALASKAALRCRELERPEEVRHLLEVKAHCVDLVDDVFHAMHAKLTELIRNDFVVAEGNAALVDLAKATLVDEIARCLERRVAVSDIWLHIFEHLQNGFVDLQEDTVVQLLQAKQLQDLSGLGAELNDANNARDEKKLGLRLHEEISCSLSLAAGRDELALEGGILLVVLQCAHLQLMASVGALLLLGSGGGHLLVGKSSITCELQLHRLGDCSAFCDGVLGDCITLRHSCTT